MWYNVPTVGAGFPVVGVLVHPLQEQRVAARGSSQQFFYSAEFMEIL